MFLVSPTTKMESVRVDAVPSRRRAGRVGHAVGGVPPEPSWPNPLISIREDQGPRERRLPRDMIPSETCTPRRRYLRSRNRSAPRLRPGRSCPVHSRRGGGRRRRRRRRVHRYTSCCIWRYERSRPLPLEAALLNPAGRRHVPHVGGRLSDDDAPVCSRKISKPTPLSPPQTITTTTRRTTAIRLSARSDRRA